jgi:hypothetical protein
LLHVCGRVLQLVAALSEFWHNHYLPGQARLQALSAPSDADAETGWSDNGGSGGIDDHMAMLYQMQHFEPVGEPTNANLLAQEHDRFLAHVRKVAQWQHMPESALDQQS